MSETAETDETRIDENSVELLATIVTGLEFVAANEVEDKLGIAEVKTYLGAARWKMPLERLPEALKLRSIDNISIILYEKKLKGLCVDSQEKALERITELVPCILWTTGIRAWQTVRGQPLAGGEEMIEKQLVDYKHNTPTSLPNPEISFRVSCNRAGEKSRHKFSSMDAQRALGGAIQEAFGWTVKMKEMQLNVGLNIRSEWATVTLALNEETLFKRNLVSFGPTSLRSTIAFCLVHLVHPKPGWSSYVMSTIVGEIVVDALCGGGSIPLEAAASTAGALYLAGDNHPEAIKRCIENRVCRFSVQMLQNANVDHFVAPVDFFSWDATKLPLKEDSVDAIVTDLPFGKKIGSRAENRVLYSTLLKQWSVIMKKKGRLVVLTQDKRNLEAAVMEEDLWKVHQVYKVNIGGLDTVCALLLNEKQ